ncbi:protein translocase subunit SecF [Megasphaera hominis]|jgi:preprotein translocase subunit SecF|uniref:Protein-export membrane protein SecF n=1 Tax=Megasphaera hominis TaxID=159836 RepID=A0ABR6VHH6_9FIRM|nr:protein translocase subunit SecF [Megasphaera hominis]MBC3536759.1 protein translocase subunit SecF [Megasphaera hominis]
MRFDIVAHKKWWFTLSSVLVIFSIVSMFVNGFNFGIDYTGGTILDLQFKQPVTVEQVRNVVDSSKLNLSNSVIQLSGVTDQDASQDVMIRMRNLTSEESKEISDDLSNQLGGAEVKRTESVGAVIGSEVTKNAIINLAVAFIALAAYITFRFEYKIAISAIVSILHDLIMVLGVFSFFHLEIDATFLAAILTVVGYSMNEAVVIFDRVRENTRTHRRTDTYEKLAHDSIAQSIHRSIYTLTTVLFACGALHFFGGDSTKNFSLVMLIGFISGAYSSICVDTSLWVVWKNHSKNSRRGPKAEKEIEEDTDAETATEQA